MYFLFIINTDRIMNKLWITLLIIATSSFALDPSIEDEELRALNVLLYLNKRQPELQNKIATATWNHESNITEETVKEKVKKNQEYISIYIN